MINFYYYDTANGRVLATGSYEERGDGAASRAVASGVIAPATEYAPAGVKTARPSFNLATLLLDKLAIVANAVDAATLSGIPAGTTVKVYKDQDAIPRAIVTVNDGTLVFTVDTAGSYQLVLSNFPTQETTFTVRGT